MITIKNNTLDRIKDWTDESIHILIDFDRTITDKNSVTSWGIISSTNSLPEEYSLEYKKLFGYYRPLEIDESLEYEQKCLLMEEWWQKHIDLFVKYQLSEEIIKKYSKDSKMMTFRKGAQDFLRIMKDKNIPVIIVSAGIGNFIKQFLINNNCYFDNIYIISNFLTFKDGIAQGVYGKIIHSLNKSEIEVSDKVKNAIQNRPNIVLFGDAVADIRMAKKDDIPNALKIGFLNEKVDDNKSYFEEHFDIVCVEDGFDSLINSISIFK